MEKKKDGATIIVIIGDSINFGQIVAVYNANLAYPVKLMEMLKDTKKYEVINLGL